MPVIPLVKPHGCPSETDPCRTEDHTGSDYDNNVHGQVTGSAPGGETTASSRQVTTDDLIHAIGGQDITTPDNSPVLVNGLLSTRADSIELFQRPNYYTVIGLCVGIAFIALLLGLELLHRNRSRGRPSTRVEGKQRQQFQQQEPTWRYGRLDEDPTGGGGGGGGNNVGGKLFRDLRAHMDRKSPRSNDYAVELADLQGPPRLAAFRLQRPSLWDISGPGSLDPRQGGVRDAGRYGDMPPPPPARGYV